MRLPDFLPRAVLCDMDGLLLDTERLDGEIWREVLGEQGLEYPPSVHASVVGLHGAETVARLQSVFGVDAPVARWRDEVMVRWEKRLAQAPAPRRPGAVELLDWLAQRRIPVAVATSTRRVYALQRLGSLAIAVTALACGDEVERRKPAPDLYRLALARLGMVPDGCIALEDSEPGVCAAAAAGLPVVAVADLTRPSGRPYSAQSLWEVLAAWEALA